MTLRQFLQDNFGWDLFDWDPEDIIFLMQIVLHRSPTCVM